MTEQCYVPPNLNSGNSMFGPFSQREMIIFTAFVLGGMLIAQSGRSGSGAFALILILTGVSFILIRHFLPSAARYFLHYRRAVLHIEPKHNFPAARKSKNRADGAVLSFTLGEINFASASRGQKEAFLSSFISLCCTANSSSKFISAAFPDDRKDSGVHTRRGFEEYRTREHYAVLSNESQTYLLRALSNDCSDNRMKSYAAGEYRFGEKRGVMAERLK